MTIINLGNTQIPRSRERFVVYLPDVEKTAWGNITPLNCDLSVTMVYNYIKGVSEDTFGEHVIVVLDGHIAACYQLIQKINDEFLCCYYDPDTNGIYDIKTGENINL